MPARHVRDLQWCISSLFFSGLFYHSLALGLPGEFYTYTPVCHLRVLQWCSSCLWWIFSFRRLPSSSGILARGKIRSETGQETKTWLEKTVTL